MLAATIVVSTATGIKRLHLIQIQNDGTGTPEFGNYNVSVFLDEYLIQQGRVEGYAREYGALKLLYKALETLIHDRRSQV
jgi:hypothetical protein